MVEECFSAIHFNPKFEPTNDCLVYSILLKELIETIQNLIFIIILNYGDIMRRRMVFLAAMSLLLAASLYSASNIAY